MPCSLNQKIWNFTIARVLVMNNLLTSIPSLYLMRLFGLKLTVSCLSAFFVRTCHLHPDLSFGTHQVVLKGYICTQLSDGPTERTTTIKRSIRFCPCPQTWPTDELANRQREKHSRACRYKDIHWRTQLKTRMHIRWHAFVHTRTCAGTHTHTRT